MELQVKTDLLTKDVNYYMFLYSVVQVLRSLLNVVQNCQTCSKSGKQDGEKDHVHTQVSVSISCNTYKTEKQGTDDSTCSTFHDVTNW